MRIRHPITFFFLVISFGLALGPLTSPTYSSPDFAMSGPQRLTSIGDLRTITWLPGGNAILVTRSSSGIVRRGVVEQQLQDLYRVDLKNGTIALLAPNAAYPAPSNSGSEIAFVSLLSNGDSRLRVLDQVANHTRNVAAVDWGGQPAWNENGMLNAVSSAHGVIIAPSSGLKSPFSAHPLPFDATFSPSAKMAAYAASDGLHVLADGRDRRVFTTLAGQVIGGGIQWSHAGNRLAFILTRGGLEPEIRLVNSDGSGSRLILRGGLEYVGELDWAPDDSNLIFTRTPTGSSAMNASEIWRAGVGGEIQRMTRDREEESVPRYSPDGSRIAFVRGGDLWVVETNAAGLFQVNAKPGLASLQNVQPYAFTPAEPRIPNGQLTPPTSIRVIHSQNNTCRKVPVGQIDTIDFETYVKQVVPAEVYPSWPAEALKTQAVAARSYGWFWVLQHQGGQYDVDDSTSYQYMCDNRYPSTDDAVDATRGQYGSYAGQLIFAAYGADNGDPTVMNNWQNPYLVSVDDPVDFMDSVLGNGLGMSQWGADRWAMPPYSWNYEQILAHYYSGITIESSAGGVPDTTPPTGGLIVPWSNWGMTSNRALLIANASDDSSGVASVDFIAQYMLNGTHYDTTISHLTQAPWQFTWDISGLPDQAGIQVTPKITDFADNVFNGNGVSFTLDRGLPVGTVIGPPYTDKQTVTLECQASDSGPSGLTQMAFSNNWIWEGESQLVTPPDSAVVVNDSAALDGKALYGQAGVNPSGVWYGPYTYALVQGNAYRVYFRLKTDNASTTDEIALLDVVDNSGANLLGMKRLRGTDFRAGNTYQEFYVDFDFVGPVTNGLEFRVAYRANASLWLDRMIVVGQPVPYAPTAQWTLTDGNGSKTVQAKYMDGAGNVSDDAVTIIVLGPYPSPTPTATTGPRRLPPERISATATPTRLLLPMRTPTPLVR